MKKTKLKKVFIFLITIVFIYISISIYLSVKFNLIVKKINEGAPYNYQLHAIMSNQDYKSLYNNKRYTDENVQYYEKFSRSFPITVILPNKALIYYKYTYECYEKGSNTLLCGSNDCGITITVKLKNWKWVVEEVYETP